MVIQANGLDYDIHYKSGKENLAADALSRISGTEIFFMALSVIDTNLESLIKHSYHLDNNLISVVEELQDQQRYAGFELKEGFLRKHQRIVIGPDTQLRQKLISWQHSSPEGGHSATSHP